MTGTHTLTMLTAGLLCCATAAVAADSVCFVDHDADVGGDGLSWDTAYRFVSDALTDAAASGGAVTDIHIAGGLYQPDRSESAPDGTGDRQAAFQLIHGVNVRGGYLGLDAGPGESPDDRNIEQYPTVFTGDLAGDDLPGFINNAENSHHVVTAQGVGAPTELDGVTMTAGHADGVCCFYNRGAGLYLVGGSTLIVRDCTIEYNIAPDTINGNAIRGGGVYIVTNSHATFIGTTIRGNQVRDHGAGVYVLNSNPAFFDCTFEENTTLGLGGGLAARMSSVTFDGCLFINNSGGFTGGAIFNWTGASSIVTDCQFIGNMSLGSYFGDRGEGGAISCYDEATTTVTDSTFTGNQAVLGGAIMMAEGDASVSQCVFENNRATGHGGAIANAGFFGSVSMDLSNCQFIGNTSVVKGGAVFDIADIDTTYADCTFVGNTSTGAGLDSGSGGAVSTEDGTTLLRCLFTENYAQYGGAIILDGGGVVINCLVFDNQAAQHGGGILGANGQSTVINTTIAHNHAGIAGGGLASQGSYFGITHVTAHNTIVWENSAPSGPQVAAIDLNLPHIHKPAELSLSYSNIQGGQKAAFVDRQSTLHWLAGNIHANPNFAGATTLDYHILPGSPCIDAADNTAIPVGITGDFDGNPRFVDDPAARDTGNPDGVNPPVDIGAYESQ